MADATLFLCSRYTLDSHHAVPPHSSRIQVGHTDPALLVVTSYPFIHHLIILHRRIPDVFPPPQLLPVPDRERQQPQPRPRDERGGRVRGKDAEVGDGGEDEWDEERDEEGARAAGYGE